MTTKIYAIEGPRKGFQIRVAAGTPTDIRLLEELGRLAELNSRRRLYLTSEVPTAKTTETQTRRRGKNPPKKELVVNFFFNEV